MSAAPRGRAQRAPVLSTYRLQLRNGVTFATATRLVPYLHELGISHVYCSPYLRARPGSTHGYDVVDHAALDPELGDESAFDAFVAALHARGMGHILDFVPNHAGVFGGENPDWMDLLEHGRASPAADIFDVDWNPPDARLRGRVLLPVLGDLYGRVLERGELSLAFDPTAGALQVSYHEHRFPIRPRDYAEVLEEASAHCGDAADALRELAGRFAALDPRPPSRRRAAQKRERAREARRELARLATARPAVARAIDAALERLRGRPGEPRSFRALHRLLDAQHYRLAHWRVAADEINYRRFFDINDLAGLRMERPEVFERTHHRVFAWSDAGTIEGLRIDHVDGLLDPQGYCEALRQRCPDLYLVVEKILAAHERLRDDWRVDGTTGYEFLNLVNGLFVDPMGAAPLERLHAELTGRGEPFARFAWEGRRHVMETTLRGELDGLAHALAVLSEADRYARDFTLPSLREALKEVVACLRVYRTYVGWNGASPEDRAEIGAALEAAHAARPDLEPALFEWLGALLRAEIPPGPTVPWPRREGVAFARRAQQYTGPVAAKGVEDTAFYRHHRLVSLNEVGGDPDRFGVSVEEFHRDLSRRARQQPRSMLATSTHDTKRGEDVRARLDVLSEIPAEWEAHVRRWRAEGGAPTGAGGATAPGPGHAYLVYQTLLGTWPPGSAPDADYTARMEAFAVKAAREGKERSSWRRPDEAYEAALTGLVRRLLEPDSAFRRDFEPFARRVAELAVTNSLAQLALKLTAPGVPDVYQGCELWDLSLVDPDNRRPVDFEARAELLTALGHQLPPDARAAPALLRELLASWPDGRIKLFASWRLLELRRRWPELLVGGDYAGLETRGERSRHLCASLRRQGDAALLVVVPRLCAGLPRGDLPAPLGVLAWGDAAVWCPRELAGRRFRDALTGRELCPQPGPGGAELAVAELLAELPIFAGVAAADAG